MPSTLDLLNSVMAIGQLKDLTSTVLEVFEKSLFEGKGEISSADNLEQQYSEPLPEVGEDATRLLRRVAQDLAENSTLPIGEGHFGHMQAVPAVPAIAGDFIASILNQSMDTWDQAPAATHVERTVIGWFGGLVGYGPGKGGVMTPGATLSNLMALFLARELNQARSEKRNAAENLKGTGQRRRVISAGEDHDSVDQAVKILGLGEKALIRLEEPLASNYLAKLEAVVRSCKKRGEQVVAAVVTAGTTVRGYCPPLAGFGRFCRQNGIWAHVDAAHGGGCLLSAKYRHLLAGIEEADSVAVDAHKLLFQPIACGLFLVSDASRLRFFNRRHLPYYRDNQWNLLNNSLLTSRPFDALKIYLTLKVAGRAGVASALERLIDAAREVAEEMRRSQVFSLLESPTLNIVVFGLKDSVCRGEEERSSRHQALIDFSIQSHRVGLSPSFYGGRSWLRMVVGNSLLGPSAAQQLVTILEQKAREVVG